MVFKLCDGASIAYDKFENDVKMYGTQAKNQSVIPKYSFENDVKMYGTQARNAQGSH